MTSTPHDSSSPEPAAINETERWLQPVLQSPIVQRLRLGSIGTRLFASVMGGALVGMAGMAFLFGEVVKFQAEGEIQQAVNDKASAVKNTLGQAEVLAETFRTSVLTLHNQKAETPSTYRNLVLELFNSRPEFVLGLGLGQSQNGILPGQQWFFSYYASEPKNSNSAGEPNSPADGKTRYMDGTGDDFYPDSDRYKNYFLPQKDLWTLPGLNSNTQPATYYSQILDRQGKWLGTVFVDLDSAVLNTMLKDTVLHNAGFFALLSEEGQLLSAPASANLPATESATTYREIPGLEFVWAKFQNGESGLVEGDRGYWAYARVPGKPWITVGFVPYRAVFSRVALITIGSTIAVGLLLAVLVALTVRYLNYRLRPILNECNRLAATDAETLTLLQHQDEIGQLSIAFFNLLEQVKTNEIQIRQESARTAEAEAQLQQAEAHELTEQAMREELGQLLTVIAAVEQGNLTVETPTNATVNAKTNAPITQEGAETLNRLVDRLRQIMFAVRNATEHVTQDAVDLEQLAVDVATKVQQQTQSIAQAQTVMEHTSQLSQDAAQQAMDTNEAVQLAQSAIAQGQQEIRAIIGGVAGLEQDTQQIVKRTETLTNYVELATQFAKDQKRIAAMTRILAVNASMLASRASAQQDPEQLAIITREFETIAGQVNTLASQTNQSLVLLQQRTDQIQTVVSGLNHDVQEICQQVNTVTTGIEQSSQTFDTVKTINDRVAQMGQHVVQSSQTIADAAKLALTSIQDISTIASTTLKQAGVTQEQTQHLQQIAHTLSDKVDFFKLPEERIKNKR